jgi:hypothetical protein
MSLTATLDALIAARSGTANYSWASKSSSPTRSPTSSEQSLNIYVLRTPSNEISNVSSSSTLCCHSPEGENDGVWCWGCHFPEPEGKQSSHSDYPRGHLNEAIGSASLGSNASAKSARSVRFDEKVRVRRTHSKEDYPGRSMLTEDNPEDQVPSSAALDMLMKNYLARNSLPNLMKPS